jgi:hypothetical protein
MRILIKIGTYCFVALLGYLAAVILALYGTKNWSKVVGSSSTPSNACHPSCPCSVDLGA